MEPLIFDTSIWIDFLNEKINPKTTLLRKYVSGWLPHYLCPEIIREILQGIRDDKKYEALRKVLLSYDILVADAVEANIGAAEIFRTLKKKGITIRNVSDCMIAWYAIKHDIKIIHNDSDFDQISAHTTLKIHKV